MEHVIGTCFEHFRITLPPPPGSTAGLEGHATSIPGETTAVVQREIVRALVRERSEDLRMLRKCLEDRRRSAALAADDDEIGGGPEPTGCGAKRVEGVSSHRPQ